MQPRNKLPAAQKHVCFVIKHAHFLVDLQENLFVKRKKFSHYKALALTRVKRLLVSGRSPECSDCLLRSMEQ